MDKELCRMKKGLDKRIDEGVLWWFGHGERMKNDRIVKSHVGAWAGSHSVGRLQKRWIDTVKEFKEKRIGYQATRRMVQDRSAWWGFLRGNAWGAAQGMNPRP